MAVWNCRCYCIVANIDSGELKYNKSGDCESCEEFENGVSPKPLKGFWVR